MLIVLSNAVSSCSLHSPTVQQSSLCLGFHPALLRLSPVIVPPALLLAIIVRIANVVAVTLDIPHLATRPVRHVLRSILHVLNGVVPALLDAVAEAVEALLDILHHDISEVLESTSRPGVRT